MAKLNETCNGKKFSRRITLVTSKNSRSMNNGEMEITIKAEGSLSLSKNGYSDEKAVDGTLCLKDNGGLANLRLVSSRSVKEKWKRPLSIRAAEERLAGMLVRKLSKNCYISEARLR